VREVLQRFWFASDQLCGEAAQGSAARERQGARGVENWTHVRCLLGYEQLENPDLLAPLNALYRDLWRRYHNHFCPSIKLLEKRREGARQIKRHDRPKTPYLRLLESGVLEPSRRIALEQEHGALNPLKLKHQVEAGCRKSSDWFVPETRSTASSARRPKPHLTTKVA
jgi:hypothetical protein